MNKEELRIVYMGTADFALRPLQELVEQGYSIVAVVTGMDKPAGRGMKLQQNAIKRYALEQGIEVLQPEKLRDEAFVGRLRELSPDLGLVVAFRMLPEVVWQLPRLGTVNLHGSLLPRYRGAAPIHWAVINGEAETGVTTFRLKHEIDTGNILLQSRIAVAPDETTGSVYERLMHLGATLLAQTVELFLHTDNPKTIEQGQAPEGATHAPKLTKENTQVQWERPASELYNMIRGLNPFPSAWAELQLPQQSEPIVVKLHSSEVIEAEDRHQGLEAGSVVLHGKKSLEVICGGGSVLRLVSLQPSGKRAMTAQDFINGLR